MRIFISTGEASGENAAAELLAEIRRQYAGDLDAEAIGGDRLEAAGARIVQRTRGWASLGLLAALRRVPPLYAAMIATALRLVRRPPDLVVLVDYGAFNVRLARTIRRLGGGMPMLYYFPPSAWLDRAGVAREVTRRADALTAFAHQRDFYRSLGLPITFLGHPLVSTVTPRGARAAAPAGGGHVALLPGSRTSEISHHTGRLLDALAAMRSVRPALHATLVAADDDAERAFRAALAARAPLPVTIARGARAVLRDADAALIASGTAVLEAALVQTPSVSLYVVSPAQERYVRRVYRGTYVTVPNLVAGREIVPELLQSAATPQALAAATLALLDDPREQLAAFARLREQLGPADALPRCARFALALAGAVV